MLPRGFFRHFLSSLSPSHTQTVSCLRLRLDVTLRPHWAEGRTSQRSTARRTGVCGVWSVSLSLSRSLITQHDLRNSRAAHHPLPRPRLAPLAIAFSVLRECHEGTCKARQGGARTGHQIIGPSSLSPGVEGGSGVVQRTRSRPVECPIPVHVDQSRSAVCG